MAYKLVAASVKASDGAMVPKGTDKHIGQLWLLMASVVRKGPLTAADAVWLKRANEVTSRSTAALLSCNLSTAAAWDTQWSIALLRSGVASTQLYAHVSFVLQSNSSCQLGV